MTMKKKNALLWMSALVLLLTGLSACSSDDDEYVELENNVPEFAEDTSENPRNTGTQITTVDNGVKITKDSQGGIRWIFFTDNDQAPTSAAEVFSQYLGYDIERDFRLYRQESFDKMENPLSLECYQQQYKGVIIYQANYNIRFQNGKVTDCNGLCVEIDDLDVTPSFDIQEAKGIYAKYLNIAVEHIGTGGILAWFDDALMIAEFPVSKGSSQWAPRLVYALSCKGLNDEGLCFIDAHTGRILKTWPNYIN